MKGKAAIGFSVSRRGLLAQFISVKLYIALLHDSLLFQKDKLLLSWVASFSRSGICFPWLFASFGKLKKKIKINKLAKQLSSLFQMCLEQVSSLYSHAVGRLGELQE